jgi:hypothetical protein
MRRRTFLGIAIAATLVATRVTSAVPVIEVYKSPTCGCCGKWAEHLRKDGFTVNVHDIPDIDAFRARVGVPAALSACHTALVGGYVVEGHVPAADIRKLLTERPEGAGSGGARDAGNLTRHGCSARPGLRRAVVPGRWPA